MSIKYYNPTTGITREECVGQVIETWERSYAWDSDFYAKVFDGKEIKKICYASTGVCDSVWNNRAEVDASDEWIARACRFENVKNTLARRKDFIYIARSIGCDNYKRIEKLWKAYRRNDLQFSTCINLLNTKKFRSDFRQSCRDQIMAWLDEEEPKYDKPLTGKQMMYLQRRGEPVWRVTEELLH